ncbi:MAG: hypothetical protein KC636_33120 [Myxococcales bacterium]|nr:hypothetical protein [Myxococcales bacterium]
MHELLVGAEEHPRLTWDVAADRLSLNGRELWPRAAFLRYDVFAQLADPRPVVAARALAWYTTLCGWLAAHPEVLWLNRRAEQWTPNKLAMLTLARQVGLRVPSTLVTNDLATLRRIDPADTIAKPVADGHCVLLGEALADGRAIGDALARPAIVQERLVAPELRVYLVGDEALGFRVDSPHLDYRVHQQAKLTPVDPRPLGILERLCELGRSVGYDFGAADFKTDPRSGELVFLELNSSPMFAAFDRAADGRLCAAIVSALCPGASS